MIFSYTDFILESLILESNVVYSDKFRKALSKIDSGVSKSLLDIENQDFNIQSNFFDINLDKNDVVSFIPDRRAQKILEDDVEYVRFSGSYGWLKHTEGNSELFGKLGYEPSGEPYSPSSSDVGEVIKKIVSEKSGKTYVWVKFKGFDGGELGEGVYNNEKLTPVDNPKRREIWTKGRQEIKIGRAIRALLKSASVDFVDKDIEDFVNKYKSTIDIMNDKFRLFEVVDGSDIGFWYDYKNYYDEVGTLGSSCMRRSPSSYFKIYMENPEVCKLVILKSEEDNSKIKGRALLWTLTDGKSFLDRIYTMNDSDVQLFRDWARENEIYAKRFNNSSDDGQVIGLDGSPLNLDRLKVKVKEGEYDRYPYMDTLKYLNWRKGFLSTEKGDDDYILESTGGGHTTCDSCDGDGRVNCDYCDGDGYVSCGNCDGDGSSSCSNCDGESDIECSTCDGSGSIERDGEEVDCSNCDGEGRVNCDECYRGQVNCDSCDGDGRVNCDSCDGEGRVDCGECNY